jgi:hypothetical protein
MITVPFAGAAAVIAAMIVVARFVAASTIAAVVVVRPRRQRRDAADDRGEGECESGSADGGAIRLQVHRDWSHDPPHDFLAAV